MLCHKLIDVVVVAVFYAVDTVQPSAPARPLATTHPTISEPGDTCHHISRVEAVAEVEVFDLDHVLAGFDARREVLVFTNGAKRGIR